MRAEYEKRRDERQAEHDRCAAIERRLGHVRMLLALVIVVVGWMGWVSRRPCATAEILRSVRMRSQS